MNVVDAMVLALLAFADIILLIHLRRRRRRMLRARRLNLILTKAVRRQLSRAETPLLQRPA